MDSREVHLRNEIRASEERQEELFREISALQKYAADLEKLKVEIQEESVVLRDNLAKLGSSVRGIVHDFMRNIRNFQTSLVNSNTLSSNPPPCALCKCQQVGQARNESAGLVVPNSCLEMLKSVTQSAKADMDLASAMKRKVAARAYSLSGEAQEIFYRAFVGNKWNAHLLMTPSDEIINRVTFRMEPRIKEEGKKQKKSQDDRMPETERDLKRPAIEAAAGPSCSTSVQPN